MATLVEIAGIVKTFDGFSNFVLKNEDEFDINSNYKEVVCRRNSYDVEGFIGFDKSDIIEIPYDDERVIEAKKFLENSDDVQGILFLSNGFIYVTDVDFFLAYKVINGVREDFNDLVECTVYDDDESYSMIEEDFRLSF